MISKYNFIKESKQLGISEVEASSLYTSFELMLEIIKKRRMNWGKLSPKEWDYLLEIEESSQWPILQKFSEPYHGIYADVEEKRQGEAIIFRNTVRDELELRKNKKVDKKDYLQGRKELIERRFDYLLTIFEVDKKSLWKSLATLTVVAGAGLFVFGKIRRKSSQKGDEKK